MIEFKCSRCGKKVTVKDEAAGKRGKCPECGATLPVPQPEMVPLEVADPSPVVLPSPAASARTRGRAISTPVASSPKPRKRRLWLALLVVAAAVAAPFAPKFPLWFGIILLVLCAVAFVPGVQGLSRRLLRLNPAEKWRSALRLVMYGLIGLALILAGWAGAGYKSEQDRLAAKQAAEEAERQRLANEANAQVVAVVAEAKTAWTRGNPRLAEEKLEAASKTPKATNLALVQQLRARMANAKVEALTAEAINALKTGGIDAAREKVTTALAVPHANTLAAAKKLDEQIGNATDPAHIRAALMELPDEAFRQLRENGELPAQFVSGYEGLDRRIADLAKAQTADVSAAREQRRQEQVAREHAAAEAARKAEEERKAREIAAAEAARKAEEERQAREIAQREAAQKEAKDRLDAYVALLDAAEVRLIDNVSVRRIGDSMWEATLTVDNLWHVRHYQVRLQDAQTLWEAWARIASPKEPDSARIKIVDQRGNEVGGSRVWGGSLIWVQED